MLYQRISSIYCTILPSFIWILNLVKISLHWNLYFPVINKPFFYFQVCIYIHWCIQAVCETSIPVQAPKLSCPKTLFKFSFFDCISSKKYIDVSINLKILSLGSSMIAKNNTRTIILEIKPADVKSLKY